MEEDFERIRWKQEVKEIRRPSGKNRKRKMKDFMMTEGSEVDEYQVKGTQRLFCTSPGKLEAMQQPAESYVPTKRRLPSPSFQTSS